MGDRLGTPDVVGIPYFMLWPSSFFFLFFLLLLLSGERVIAVVVVVVVVVAIVVLLLQIKTCRKIVKSVPTKIN